MSSNERHAPAPTRRLPTCTALIALACAASAPAWSATGALSTTVHPALWPRVQWPLPESPRLQRRIAAIIARMTVPEKVGQIIQADIDYVTPEQVAKYHLGSILTGANSGPDKNPIATAQQWLRLADRYQAAALQGSGIPLLFGADCVHGAQKIVGATLYPQNIALGATRDPALVEKIEAATAEEMRTVGFNWAFAPGVMVPQNDRWGRVYEGFSQDPALVARMARAAVLGFQGTPGTPDFLDARHVAATAKHFLGDGSTTDGIDEGDAEVSERDLIRVANAGYPPAIAAGVQAIMVSYSSWNGVKMSANRALLTDVLKRRMDFGGFLISDWDAVRQLPGCVGAACPKAIDAGIDMAMEPNNWRAFYTNTLREVEKGSIPMQRLDHAVARILAVKLRMGLFTQGLPSQQPLGGKFDLIGAAAHRALARQAVRESLVLLKNAHHLLPLKPGQRVLVAGPGADSLPLQNGGWTLTWQGTGTNNADFPGATSIWAGIRQAVAAAGGTAELSVDGHYTRKPDVAIVVYGEKPYAEYLGDRPNLEFEPRDGATLRLLRRLRQAGIPVVSIFLTGRPLWVNREINASDAFVVAWLPGSEGEGVADVLFRKPDGGIAFDFRGKLPAAWPMNAVDQPGLDGPHALFPYGYGLNDADNGDLRTLPTASGIEPGAIAVAGR